jgi:ABC-type phosphate transport system permease subunit
MKMQENIGLFDAISRCFSLIKGYWWQTAGILFVLYVLVSMISYVFAIPVWIIIVGLFAFSAENSGLLTILLPILSTLVIVPSLVVYALFPVAQALQYYNLVERKEAAGLREKIEDLQSPEQGWAQGGTL